MPKNSRPDIQVLEDRVVRLRNQLTEYKDLRLYSVTKKRLSAVSDELVSCISIIQDIVGMHSNDISPSSLSALTELPGEGPAEFSSDDDLLDTFLLPKSADSSRDDHSAYSKREIVKTFSNRLQECANTLGCSSGILQVNQFCQLLNSWYQTRFPATKQNPNFFFKASRIHEWIDLLIIAAGDSLQKRMFSAFLSDMKSWIEDLNTDKDQRWVLPYSVMQIKNSVSSYCSDEAVLLEKMVKPLIYDDSFYPEEKYSIEKIVIDNSNVTKDDLTVEAIIQRCNSRIIVTGSFDASKYREG